MPSVPGPTSFPVTTITTEIKTKTGHIVLVEMGGRPSGKNGCGGAKGCVGGERPPQEWGSRLSDAGHLVGRAEVRGSGQTGHRKRGKIPFGKKWSDYVPLRPPCRAKRSLFSTPGQSHPPPFKVPPIYTHFTQRLGPPSSKNRTEDRATQCRWSPELKHRSCACSLGVRPVGNEAGPRMLSLPRAWHSPRAFLRLA
ncbi:hypothetical protein E2320_013811 [Naja naja]|nr:hypothetical protein E2320_013811 [Naja naja]